MKDYLFQIKKEILRAKVSNDEHHNLMQIFSKLGEDEQRSLLELFRESPEWISKISTILKLKKDMLASGKVIDWQKLISEEENSIGNLEKN